MKSKVFFKSVRRSFIILIVLTVILNILPTLTFNNENKMTASAATTLSQDEIKARFDVKMGDLRWVDSNKMEVTAVNDYMWQDTSDMRVNWIDGTGITSETKLSNAVGYRLEIPYGQSVWNYLDESDDSVSNYAYSDSINQVSDSNLYYTIEYDGVLGYYRQYYVSSADQLALLLYHYEKDFSSTLQASTNECTGTRASKLGIVLLNDIDLGGRSGKHWKGYCSGSVRLEIDGQGHTIYNGYFTETDEFFIGRSGGTYYPRYFAIHDVTFSNMYMGRDGGMFGQAKWAYFYNVNWTHCLAAGDEVSSSSSIVFHCNYLYVFLKDCTIDNSYVAGTSHCALFASYNGGRKYSADSSYIGDSTLSYIGETDTPGRDKTLQGFYYTSVPDSVEDAEIAWGGLGKTWDDGKTYWMQQYFPSIYEDCATLDSAVYDAGSNHSGTFVSCVQGGLIFKNCFTNCTIYANTQLGVFLGAVIGCGDGFNYCCCDDCDGCKDCDNCHTEFVNVYFENCYTSGTIEGATQLGGFVGVVFNDVRAYHSITLTPTTDSNNVKHYTLTNQANTHRGKAVFINCYSTSSVGMQYASEYTGGFAGVVVANIRAEDPDDRQHIFVNCYAAGEVGGIATNTSTDDSNTNSIGGFFGSYVQYEYKTSCVEDLELDGILDLSDSTIEAITRNNDGYITSIQFSVSPSTSTSPVYEWYKMGIDFNKDELEVANLSNCYYDKQTTAMRERDIGTYNKNKNYTLVNSLNGLTGVYTKTSSAKSVDGLADTSGIMNSSDWKYMTDYYPQLNVFFNYSYPDNLSDEAKAMHEKRAALYKNYALASTATVLLDHYDQYLDTKGILVDADILVYDTVRDITRKFEFTTDDSSKIKWAIDTDRNNESGYIDTINADGNGFEMSFEIQSDDETKKSQTITHNPKVLSIVYDDTIKSDIKYKCVEFAPGRQWVAVTAGSDEQMGKRQLRLLPTAYLSAGGTLDVNVVPANDSTSLYNEVKYGDYTLPTFNHSAGVAYALTDATRMSSIAGDAQTVNEYSKSDTSSFALYGGYLLSGSSSAVGLTSIENENDDNESVNIMYSQQFKVTGQANDSSEGMTMVKVFKTEKTSIGDSSKQYILELGDEITEAEELKKWSGEKPFDGDDIGYYYMVYYWRLNDGRYLTDNKLVKIKSESHTVEIITGILNEKNVKIEGSNNEFKMAIDQYVTDEAFNADGMFSYYPSYLPASADFEPKDAYNDYNELKVYGGEDYYIKSNKITSTGDSSVVGWHRTTDYRLTTLIVEVQTPDGKWVEMARINEGDGDSKFDFSQAKYSYTFSGYTVTQNPETKLFTVEERDNSEQSFAVENSMTTSGIESYIQFKFESDDNVDMTYDTSSSLRVTALFRQNYADVYVDKTVLKFPDDFAYDFNSVDEESFESKYKEYEVDDTGISSTSDRKAVLSGDTLTYRMKLYNNGFFSSDVVNVYDAVPDGCEFISGSMKIFRQEKDIEDLTYGGVEEIDLRVDNNYVAEYDQDDNVLHWQIPTVEMDYEYYLEYQVKVSQLSPTVQKETLYNTAQYSFIMQNGDVIADSTSSDSSSIDYFKEHAVFNMDIKTSAADTGNTTYEIFFSLNKKADGVTYKDISFSNVLPEGYVLVDGTLQLIDVSDVSNENIIAEYKNADVCDTDSNSFKISELSVEDDKQYKVIFECRPNNEQQDNEKSDGPVNKASIIYTRVDSDSDQQSMGQSISLIERDSNTVETDVTHLYINVEKRIENDDPSQTFLFKIERFDDQKDSEPAETFYTQINCIKQTDGTVTGSQLIQVDKRGYYKITEITDWSNTDYDSVSTEVSDVTVSKASLNGSMSVNDKSVAFALPRCMYESGAFPTILGTLSSGSYPAAIFINKESAYAYLSGQAYAENSITKGEP